MSLEDADIGAWLAAGNFDPGYLASLGLTDEDLANLGITGGMNPPGTPNYPTTGEPSYGGSGMPGYGTSAGGTNPAGTPNYPTTGDSSTGGSGAGLGGFGLSDIIKAVGGIPGLVSILGAAGGGYLANSATQKATEAQLAASQKAEEQIKGALGGNSGLYQPYMDAGKTAIARMQAQAPSNIAGNFRPLGTGFSLSNVARGR